jgi:hypothetical protein
MQINKNIAISDSGFVFNPSTGDSFSTNQVGLEIIRLLKENRSKEELIKELVLKFSTDESTLEKDLGDFFMMLNSYQILVNND